VPPAEDGILPHSLYFLRADGQVWSSNRQVESLDQRTDALSPIQTYDVSMVDGSIAYATSDGLYVLGPEMDEPLTLSDASAETVRWSPDGTQIAFAREGIRIIRPEVGEESLLIADDPDAGSTHRVIAWSPSGDALLVHAEQYPHVSYLGILSPDDATLRPLEEIPACCNPTWSADGTFVYTANPDAEFSDPGLWRVNVNSGEVERLLAGTFTDNNETLYMLASNPFQDRTGTLFLFYNVTPYPELPLLLHRASPDDVQQTAELLHPDEFLIQEVLWDPAGRGAVVRHEQHDPDATLVHWVPTDDSPLTQLPFIAEMYRWGP
jgi:Tol biopolymer transport system component